MNNKTKKEGRKVEREKKVNRMQVCQSKPVKYLKSWRDSRGDRPESIASSLIKAERRRRASGTQHRRETSLALVKYRY